MGLVANCDECGRTRLGVKGVPQGWDYNEEGALLCPKCNGNAMLPDDPHPVTGEAFSEVVEFVEEVEVQQCRLSPPMPPSDVVEEYDDEGEVIDTRRLSDAEYEADCRAYEAALKRYQKTGGVLNTPGKKTVSGRFRCPSGSWAEGFWDGERWLWTHVMGVEEGHRVCPRCEGKRRKFPCLHCRGKGTLKRRTSGDASPVGEG